MNGWELTEEQVQLREAARRFAKDYLAPTAHALEATGEAMPIEVLHRMRDQGFLGLDIPEEYGGVGLDALSTAIVLEQIAGGWFSASLHGMALASGPLVRAGSDAQKRRWLPRIAAGEVWGAFALTEADGGSDASSLRTFARRDGDDWVIDGSKIFITNGDRADLVLLFARTERDAARGKGISIFLIEGGTPGMSAGRRFPTIAHRANPIAELVFENCRVPGDALVGREGEGFNYIQVGFARTRAVYGARATGVAQAALDYAAHYAQHRRQFGQPVGEFQSLRFKIADLATKIEAARQLSYRAAALVDRGEPDAPVAAAMAKHFASCVAVETTQEAIQILGGHGMICDHPVERYYREAKLFQIGDGTTQMLQMLISRHVNRQARDGMSASLTSR